MASASTSWSPRRSPGPADAARGSGHTDRALRAAQKGSKEHSSTELHTISSLGTADARTATVAGPDALLVAKLHKISERVSAQDRVKDKDALDVLRLLRAVPTADLANRLRSVSTSSLAAETTKEAIANLADLFGDERTEGVEMIIRALGGMEDEAVMRASTVILARDLMDSHDESTE